MIYRLIFPLLILTSPVYGQVDLDSLFVPPTEAEIQSILNEWKERDLGVYQWRIEATVYQKCHRIDVVSHNIAGSTHYGFIRYPLHFDPDRSYPLIVATHGSRRGINHHIFEKFDGCLSHFFVIVPSFRGEMLNAQGIGLGKYLSEGDTNPMDKDVDDALTLLNGALVTIPQVDKNNIAAFGSSRGGTVALLMNIRDKRIKNTVVYSASTDLVEHPGMQELIETRLEDCRQIVGPAYLAQNYVVIPYLSEQLSLEEARRELHKRSVIYFAAHISMPIQMHAGTLDTSVEASHSSRLQKALADRGKDKKQFQSFVYEVHHNNVGGKAKANMQLSFCKMLQQTKDHFSNAYNPDICLDYDRKNQSITPHFLPADRDINILNTQGKVLYQLRKSGINDKPKTFTLQYGIYFLVIHDPKTGITKSRKLMIGPGDIFHLS